MSKWKKSESHGGAKPKKPFLCGVCEGFYGRPWTKEQRMDLFHKMQCMEMNTYLYAPKDDYKHRLQWRELYDDKEQEELIALIDAAKANNVTFVYALSPGLDMIYSSSQELQLLRDKLSQIQSFGCTAFALLFDDIDSDLCDQDRREFRSFADAQATVSNMMYIHLGKPSCFLFCPTEYCSSRAIPDLPNSEYMDTLGQKLLPDIDIMWTGNRVVSSKLTEDNIRQVSTCIRRQPVIWDNLHANDYDRTRVYLGPYDGRSSKLLKHLNGVLTNPNCEYGANFIALHTLAQWSKNVCCSFDFKRNELDYTSVRERSSSMADYSDSEGNDEEICDNITSLSDDDDNASDGHQAAEKSARSADRQKCSAYHAKTALVCAIKDWIPEFYCENLSGKSISNNHTSQSKSGSSSGKKTSKLDSLLDRRVSPRRKKNKEEIDRKLKSDHRPKRQLSARDVLSSSDLLTLVDLYYLPFGHGPRAIRMLKDAHWLIANTFRLGQGGKIPKEERSAEVCEWYDIAIQFDFAQRRMSISFDKLMKMTNRVLLYELYHYISDIRSVLSMINSYIKWHASGKPDNENYWNGEQEPWVHRGGLHAEFRRLLPHEGLNDLFVSVPKEIQQTNVYTVRPYFSSDREDVYSMCMKTFDDGIDGSDLFPDCPKLAADHSVGALLEFSSEYCYLLTDDAGICGYFLSTPDAKSYRAFFEESWKPKMQKKYPKPSMSAKNGPVGELTSSFYANSDNINNDLYKEFPAFMIISILGNRVTLDSVAKQLFCVGFKTLSQYNKSSSNSSSTMIDRICGVHTMVHKRNINFISWLMKHNFEDISRQHLIDDKMLVLAQKI